MRRTSSMPWKELSTMDEKLCFIRDCLRGDDSMTALCERYGISRETGYVWKRRYDCEGAKGLEERSRAPLHHGRQIPDEIAAAIVALRRKRPYWGAKKLIGVLERRHPEIVWPALSTATDILHRAGLIQARRRRRRPVPVDQPFAAVMQANDTWGLDLQGWVRTHDRERCDPLNVTDAHTRYPFGCQIMPGQNDP